MKTSYIIERGKIPTIVKYYLKKSFLYFESCFQVVNAFFLFTLSVPASVLLALQLKVNN